MSRRTQPPSQEQVLAAVTRYLRGGTRSIAECRARLRSRQIPEPLINTIVNLCIARGWLDDTACTKLWVTKLAEQGFAISAIRDRLIAKGLSEQVIEPAVSALQRAEDDDQRARLLVQRLLVTLRGDRRDVRLRRRLERRLAQRGFDQDVMSRALADFSEDVSITS